MSLASSGGPPDRPEAGVPASGPRKQNIGKASPVLFLVGLLFLLLRFFSTVIIAYRFGAGRMTDLLFWALLIPVSSSFLNRSVINLSFIPIFTERLVGKDEEGAWQIAAGFLNLLALVAGGLTILYVVLAPGFFHLVAHGLGEQGHAEAVRLTRILSPILLLVPLFAFMESILYSFSHYTTTAVATLFTNLGTIAGVLLLAPSMGIAGVAWGTLGGYVLQLFIPLPLIFPYRRHYTRELRLDDPGLRRILSNVAPVFYLSINMLGQWLIVYALATRLGEGILSAYRYGATLVMILPLLVQSSLLTPLYPRMSEKVAQGRKGELVEMISTYFRIITFAVLPIAVLTMVLREPLVKAIFERGKFGPEDTHRTAIILLTYAPWMLAMCYSTLLFNVYLSLGKALRIAKLLTVQLVVLPVLAFGLMAIFHEAGIPLGISLIFYVQTVVLILLLRRELGGLGLGKLIRPNLTIFVASVLMAVPGAWLCAWAQRLVQGWAQAGWRMAVFTLAQFGLLAGVGLASLLVYLVLCWVLGVPEARKGWDRLIRRQAPPEPR